jgi:MFS superfamily sulfate permease-like transporter
MKFPESSTGAPSSIKDCLSELFKNPSETLVKRWNWKASLFSSLCRGTLFFAVNAGAGMNAALGAMYAEFAYRSMTAGFYGAITQQFRRAEPRWAAAWLVGLGIPVVSHLIEFAVHWLRGTPHLRSSVIASVCFTVVSTLFNLHAMREGVLLAGAESSSLWEDLQSLPRVVISFLVPARKPRG